MCGEFIDKEGNFAFLYEACGNKKCRVYFCILGESKEFEERSSAVAALHDAGYERKTTRNSVCGRSDV